MDSKSIMDTHEEVVPTEEVETILDLTDSSVITPETAKLNALISIYNESKPHTRKLFKLLITNPLKES
jgi:hypothetical protein